QADGDDADGDKDHRQVADQPLEQEGGLFEAERLQGVQGGADHDGPINGKAADVGGQARDAFRHELVPVADAPVNDVETDRPQGVLRQSAHHDSGDVADHDDGQRIEDQRNRLDDGL